MIGPDEPLGSQIPVRRETNFTACFEPIPKRPHSHRREDHKLRRNLAEYITAPTANEMAKMRITMDLLERYSILFWKIGT